MYNEYLLFHNVSIVLVILQQHFFIKLILDIIFTTT